MEKPCWKNPDINPDINPDTQQLAKKAMETGPTKSFEDLVPKEDWEFQDVFSKKSFDQLPARNHGTM